MLDAAPPEWVRELEQCLQDGRVWLLLDGADEMGVVDALGTLAQQLRVPLLKNVRVVLTVRLNLWDAGGNALSDFDTYKVLDFSYKDSKNQDQVKQFIDKWFGNSPLNPPFLRGGGGELRTALDEKGKKRIKDLVRNPLRLALLCYTWQSGQGKLPNTKAELYSVFVEALYELKKGAFPTTSAQRRDLNAALRRLALKAIDTGAKSILPHRLVYEELEKPHPELFEDALNLGWLNRIGVNPQNPLKCVYAFFHPTFQEYFAATAIDNWHFFLNHIPHNPDIGKYRIFEPQWKEVILLWLGREDVPRKQKEKFIQALVEFEDGCSYWNFYGHRAYFLAASGIAEFGDCSRVDEIVAQIVEWGFGYFDEEQEWVRIIEEPIAEGARAVLPETERTKTIIALEELLQNSQSEDILWLAAESLGEIEPGNPIAIKAIGELLQNPSDHILYRRATKSLLKIDSVKPTAIRALGNLAQNAEDEFVRQAAVELLLEIEPGNSIAFDIAFDVLSELTQFAEYESVRREAAELLLEIDPDDPIALNALDDLLRNPCDDFELWFTATDLLKIESNNPIALDALSQLTEIYDEELPSEWAIEKLPSLWAAESLLEIEPGNPIALDAIVYLTRNAQNEAVRWDAAKILLEIEPGNPIALNTIDELTQHSQNEDVRLEVVKSSLEIDSGNPTALNALVELLQHSQNENIRWKAAWELKKILGKAQMTGVVTALKDYLSNETYENDYTRYKHCYEVLWHCAQTLPYPTFYQAWHTQPADRG